MLPFMTRTELERVRAASGVSVDEHNYFLKMTLDEHSHERSLPELKEAWSQWIEENHVVEAPQVGQNLLMLARAETPPDSPA